MTDRELLENMIMDKALLQEMAKDIKEMKADIAELKADVAELKEEVAELKADVDKLMEGNKEGKNQKRKASNIAQ